MVRQAQQKTVTEMDDDSGSRSMVKNVGIPLLSSRARTLGKRLYGILNAMEYRISNGNAESLNSKIRLLRGNRNKERFKVTVMFHYGRLNMSRCMARVYFLGIRPS